MEVRASFRRFSFLKDRTLESKGWLSDVLACARELNKPEFTLGEIYAFAPRLKGLHPDNRHVEDKIRQQLQILRDNGVVNFIGRGKYRTVS